MAEKKKTVKTPPKASKAKPKKAARPSKVSRLENEVNRLKASLSEFEDRHLRLRAEFDNYRKRKERELARLLRYEGEEITRGFLRVVDDLERIVRSVDGGKPENVDAVIDGVNLVLEKLMKRLKELEVEPFESVGETFDPELHEAMMTQKSDSHKDHEITQEFTKGYRFKDKVIRHAKVVVNSASGDESE
ncbi:MAG: nucleotide exchange factor GrpE [Candidatus Neomarinimicrobiota bacterium]